MEHGEQRPAPLRPSAPPRPPPPGSSAVQRDGATQESTAIFRDFQKLHDKAFATVQKGLNADENGDSTAALQYYTNALGLLEQVLQTDCENLTGAMAAEKDSAKQMQQKMSKTKLQITYRVESLRDRREQPTSGLSELGPRADHAGVMLPSYEEAMSSSNHSLMSDSALGDSIMAAEYPGVGMRNNSSTEGTELFSIANGVQIFYISREGYVSAPSYPTSLHIVKFENIGEEDSSQETNSPPAFLQVGDWFYPLIPGASPVLHATYGAYLFPDLTAEGAGSSVGLMLPDTVSQEEKLLLEDILKNFSSLEEQRTAIQPEDLVIPSAPAEGVPSAPYEEFEDSTETKYVIEGQGVRQGTQEGQSTSSRISQGIAVATKWISWGVGKGAEKAGELISYGATKLRDRLNPEEQPRQVDPRVQTGMMYARKATHVGVVVSSFIVSKLGEATMALGRQIAPHIRQKGEKLMPKSMNTEKNKSTMDGVMEVAASGIHGFGTVYMSLEAAAKALARSLANETVNTVQHKYGEHAGRLTENTVYAVGNVAMTAHNADNLGLKAVAKRAAKDTGKAMLEDIQHKKAAAKQAEADTSGARCNGGGAPYNGSGGSSSGQKSGQPPK